MFAKQGASVFLNIQFTNAGRRLLSLGKLNFTKVILSDREINYKIGRKDYDIAGNAILTNGLSAPTFSAMTNFDGTPPIPLNIKTFYRRTTGFSETNIFLSASTSPDSRIETSVPAVILNPDLLVRLGIITSANIDGTPEFSPLIEAPSPQFQPAAGNLVLAQFFPPTTSQPTSTVIGPPFVQLWYRCIETGAGSTTYSVDRRVPNFNNTVSARPTYLLTYPMSGVSQYYGSGSSVSTMVWNMNIVRTSPEYGYMTGVTSAHTSYASIEYGGTKQYLGFDDNYRQVGIIHYTNAYTGNTFGDRLLEKSMKIHIPTIMWWRRPDYDPGKGTTGGHVFLDKTSPLLTDHVAKTTYTLLKDGVDEHAITVGRVYQKLGMVVITDPELLTTLSYKSNRNWALPPLDLSFASQPVASASTSNTTGMCQSGKTYLVTYTADYNNVFDVDGGSGDVISYGYQPSMHCGYIQRIDFDSDSSGRDKYLKVSFPSRSFPYMRTGADANSFSGTGWIANSINILVKEMATSAFTGIDNVESTGWTRTVNNGIYGNTSNALNPYFVQARQFILTRDDYNNGISYSLGEYFGNSHITESEIATSGLTYGMESFFYGNITCGHIIDDHIVRMDMELRSDTFNSSINSTFDGKVDQSTYISEIGIFNDDDELVATAKPSFPIRKNYNRHLTMRMEIIC